MGGTHSAVRGCTLSPKEEEFLEGHESVLCADCDLIPVQPMSTPSVPPLMSVPNLTDMTQEELFTYSKYIWEQNVETPMVHIPNPTKEARRHELCGNSRSPPPGFSSP